MPRRWRTLPTSAWKMWCWAIRDRMVDLKRDRRFNYMLAFKNHGEAAGSSLEHPHSQLIALPIVPKNVAEEIEGAQAVLQLQRALHLLRHRSSRSSRRGTRVVAENADFVTLAPYAPTFPFETWILPRRHESAFENSSSQMYENLARTLQHADARRPTACSTIRRTTS